MLMPKRVKYRKAQRGRMKGKAQRGSTLAFGDFGLKALEPGWVTNRQIEAARVSLARSVKRGGKIFIRIFHVVVFVITVSGIRHAVEV